MQTTSKENKPIHVALSRCGIVALSRCGIVALWHCRIVALWHFNWSGNAFDELVFVYFIINAPGRLSAAHLLTSKNIYCIIKGVKAPPCRTNSNVYHNLRICQG